MSDRPAQGRSRRFFWAGLILGTLIGAAALFLFGLMLWAPPF